MYEITLIESHKDGTMFMAHIPCQDNDVELVSGSIIAQENNAVSSGIVLAYTTITNYFPNRDAVLHYAPKALLEVRP